MSIYRNLRSAYPLIYQIKQEYYYIGYGLFRKCTKEEIKNYIEYREEFDKIIALPNLTKKDVCKLVAHYDIIFIASENENALSEKEMRDEFDNFFDRLNEDQLKSLSKQHSNYIKTMDCKDEAFYRLNKKERYL